MPIGFIYGQETYSGLRNLVSETRMETSNGYYENNLIKITKRNLIQGWLNRMSQNKLWKMNPLNFTKNWEEKFT